MANDVMIIERTRELRAKLSAPRWLEALTACVEGSPDEKRTTAMRLIMLADIACKREGGDRLLQAAGSQEGAFSLLRSLMECARWGLEPDGRHAALVPYKNNIQLIPMKEGLIRLALEHPKVETIEAEAVFHADKFVYVKGLQRKLRHVPRLDGDRAASGLRAAYAIAFSPEGAANYKVIGPEDAKRARSASASARNGGGPWTTDEPRMWEKTAVKRLVGYLPRGRRLGEVLEHDADEQAEGDRQRVHLGDEPESALARAQDGTPQVIPAARGSRGKRNGSPSKVADSLPPPSAADEFDAELGGQHRGHGGEPERAEVRPPAPPAEERGAAPTPAAGGTAPAVPASPPSAEAFDAGHLLAVLGEIRLPGDVVGMLAKKAPGEAIGSVIGPQVVTVLLRHPEVDQSREKLAALVEKATGKKGEGVVRDLTPSELYRVVVALYPRKGA